MQILEYDALTLAKMIADRQLSVTEVTRAALAQINETDGDYNAYITVCPDSALKQAAAVQQKLDHGHSCSILAGVPLAVKDNISTEGIKTTCASRMLENYLPPYDAAATERLKDAGAVILGKTNLDEFAMGSTTETSFMGVTRNPWNKEHVPGGSSGGSAVAVASRQAWYALGSDTGGSIRQPCAYCGLTGLKPTYGLVSRYGLIAFASSMDQIGPIARSAADCAAVLSLLAGHDQRDSTSVPAGSKLYQESELLQMPDKTDLKGKRIGLAVNVLDMSIQSEVADAIYRTADTMRQMGAVVEPVEIPLLDDAVSTYYLIASAEASANLARFDGIKYGFRPEEQNDEDLVQFYAKVRSQGFGTEVQRRIMLGTFALSSGYYDDWYLKALRVRGKIIAEYAALMQNFDALLTPVTSATAPRIGQSLADPLAMYLSDIFTVSANLAGLPALAFPCGQDQQGLPIGVQLIGPAFSDGSLLSIAAAFQNGTAFHRRPWSKEEVTDEL